MKTGQLATLVALWIFFVILLILEIRVPRSGNGPKTCIYRNIAVKIRIVRRTVRTYRTFIYVSQKSTVSSFRITFYDGNAIPQIQSGRKCERHKNNESRILQFLSLLFFLFFFNKTLSVTNKLINNSSNS